jgi:acyl carrier protein
METTNQNSKAKTLSDKDSVRQRCLNAINKIAGETDTNEKVKCYLDSLDFVEIVMETELEFNCEINEDKGLDNFETINDLIDWLASNVA